ncbi:hypothetical protein B4U79_17049 [Dinothrombium tinctorium]|uniref:Ig-like domain-containing protein n=1 Tax=Dinothrombium tinctorium TaxID=1965070 RepID=A0A443RLY2_9ACAR|nr:hypothetical protein B4U79_17049 [Dinothrombium tinctorium]
MNENSELLEADTHFETDPKFDSDITSTLVLEERIEELTSTTYSDLDEELGVDSINGAIDEQHSISNLLRIPFPELGLDLVDASVYYLESEQFLEDKSVKISELLSWEENWLFQKKKKADRDILDQFCYAALEAENSPNRMLIPNPSHSQSAKVGSKEVEELSDLSERNSVGSFSFSDEEAEVFSSEKTRNEQTQVCQCDSTETQATKKDACIKIVEVVPKNVPIPHFVPSQQRMGEYVEDPCFIFPPGSASVQSGILIQFCCRVKGSHPIGVSWFKEDLRLTSDEDYRIIDSVNDHILEIKCTKPHHGGNYSCVVFNHLNQKWSDFTLEVRTSHKTPKAENSHGKFYNEQIKEKENLIEVSSPTVIQRTWAERRLELSDKQLDESTWRSEKIKSPLSSDDMFIASISPTATIAEREHKKWEECAIVWPNNPYTKENIEKRKPITRTVSLDSLLDDCSLTDDSEKMPIISPSRDLNRYKRDYYVQNVGKDEALNSFEEKVSF